MLSTLYFANIASILHNILNVNSLKVTLKQFSSFLKFTERGFFECLLNLLSFNDIFTINTGYFTFSNFKQKS